MKHSDRLEYWINRATWDLIPEARDRIERETRAHVAAMMEAEECSIDHAINQLGSPQQANERFKKYNIRKEDEAWLLAMAGLSHKKSFWNPVGAILIPLMVIAVGLLYDGPGVIVAMGCMFLVWELCFYVLNSFYRHYRSSFSQRQWVRRLIAIHSLNGLVPLVLIPIMGMANFGGIDDSVTAALVLLPTVLIFAYFFAGFYRRAASNPDDVAAVLRRAESEKHDA